MREPALWAQLQRAVQRRLRYVQRASGKPVKPDIPVHGDIERIELDSLLEQRDSLVETAQVAREGCRAVHCQRAPWGKFQRSTERRVRPLPIPVGLVLNPSQRGMALGQIWLQFNGPLRRHARSGI